MKLLKIDYNYYCYPSGIDSLEELQKYLNANHASFIRLTTYKEEECVFPYLVKEGTDTVLLNISNISSVQEVDATILSRKEYDERLRHVVMERCVNCENYEDHSNDGDNLRGHRSNISLDGACFLFKRNGDRD